MVLRLNSGEHAIQVGGLLWHLEPRQTTISSSMSRNFESYPLVSPLRDLLMAAQRTAFCIFLRSNLHRGGSMPSFHGEVMHNCAAF